MAESATADDGLGPALTRAGSPGNLPRPTTSFLGRDEELTAVKERLQDPQCRLLTLAGPGGIGKTRLAIEAAHHVAGQFADGAVFVDLQPVRTGDSLESALAAPLDIPLTGGSPRERLFEDLATRSVLVLVDNVEHLLDQVDIFADIAAHAPGVRLLVTSRERLNLAAEWCVLLDGLAVPETAAGASEALPPAVALFEDRARRVRHGFSADSDLEAVSEICRLVDGTPLAIEMAASWTRAMSPPAIAAELRQGLGRLASANRDAPEHHRNMDSVFERSWALLDPDERETFARLSVFRGPFSRPAAEAIAGTSLSTLITLVDKSLVRALPDGRFRMHELLRQYALARLEASGDADATRQAHANWYTDFLVDRHDELAFGDFASAAKEVTKELGNIRTAWRYLIDRQLLAGRATAIRAISTYYNVASDDTEGATIFDALISSYEGRSPRDADDAEALVMACIGSGYLALRMGRLDYGERVCRRARQLMDEFGLGYAHGKATDPGIGLALIALTRGDLPSAEAIARESLATAEAESHRWNRHYCRYVLARGHMIRGEYEEARQELLRVHDLARAAGDRWFLGHVLNELGGVAASLEEPEEARRYYQASLDLRREADDRRGVAQAVHRLGELALEAGDYGTARRNFSWAADVQDHFNDRGAVAAALHGLGRVTLATGHHTEAARHFRDALAMAREFDYVPGELPVLVSVGELLVALGQQERGIEVLAFVRDHPGTTDDLTQRAEWALGHLSRDVPPARHSAAVSRGRAADLDTMVASLLAELVGFAETSGDGGEPAMAVDLTRREQDVAELLVAGYSNPQIARRLGVSEGTVKAHTANIYAKLGVANRVQAVARVRELGLAPTR